MNTELRTEVDFSYAFGTPHRLFICMPEASKKSLLDATETGITISWSDGDLTTHPLGAWKSPIVNWVADFTAEAAGSAMQGKYWRRVEKIPAMEYRWENDGVSITVTAVAIKDADVFRLHLTNARKTIVKTGVYGKTRRLCVNTRWVELDSPYNALLGHEGERSDRMIFLAVGAPKCPLRNWSNIDMEWELEAGKEETAYLIRPHFALIDDVEAWLSRDWEKEIAVGLDAWRRQLDRAPKFHLPDAVVGDAFYATLADVFVMREPQADGRVAGTAGTEIYRAANSVEPCFQSMVLNRTGFFAESKEQIEFVLQFQEKDGNWEDFRRWAHHMWGISGIKSWAVREYYLFTHDRKFLEESFERMLASARWSERQREKTKVSYEEDKKPPTWGLMPRGLGDGGLMDDNGDLFGVFYVHNFWHCMGLEIAAWTAKELGRTEMLDELNGYHEDLHTCILDFLESGAIQEADGSRWIPGLPGKTSGSRWGAADAITPCKIIPPHHPLADGTMKRLERETSEGGLPKNLGWLKNGIWAAIALDEIGYSHIARGEEDKVTKYLYAALNHATPLFTWCEERLPEKGTKTKSGDLQHAWTPIALSCLIRDCLLMEEDGSLHIARAVPRWWLEEGREIRVEKAPTHWGVMDYRLSRINARRLSLEMQFEGDVLPGQVILHVRTPDDSKVFLGSIKGGEVCICNDRAIIKPHRKIVDVFLDLKQK